MKIKSLVLFMCASMLYGADERVREGRVRYPVMSMEQQDDTPPPSYTAESQYLPAPTDTLLYTYNYTPETAFLDVRFVANGRPFATTRVPIEPSDTLKKIIARICHVAGISSRACDGIELVTVMPAMDERGPLRGPLFEGNQNDLIWKMSETRSGKPAPAFVHYHTNNYVRGQYKEGLPVWEPKKNLGLFRYALDIDKLTQADQEKIRSFIKMNNIRPKGQKVRVTREYSDPEHPVSRGYSRATDPEFSHKHATIVEAFIDLSTNKVVYTLKLDDGELLRANEEGYHSDETGYSFSDDDDMTPTLVPYDTQGTGHWFLDVLDNASRRE